MNIKTNKVISAANDSCIVSITTSGKVNVGGVSLERTETAEFLVALESAIRQIVSENPEPELPKK